jgi:uncharacterized SAM-binding protein YcdF (DUF218 family)
MRKLFWLLVVGLFVAGIVYFFHPFFLEGMARFLIVADKPEKADVIIVLSGDNTDKRVDYGVELYQKGYARKMIMSGGPVVAGVSYAQLMKQQALRAGVRVEDIFLADSSMSTFDDERFTLAIVKKHRFRSVIVVTSPTHSRRAKWVFQKHYSKEKIKVICSPVPLGKSNFRLSKWWERREDTSLVLWEYGSLLYYFVKRY